eukprot:TRINITY_DN11189_c0_g1_i2.p1 TRINITY_DN11189_c0_g1~~TRINITY_DN11189_c0_g1_i2.p1  ORF type:complete len:538 (-),score=88.88 TRINITY_DN11189_c0_g1_i2:76-1572(-)
MAAAVVSAAASAVARAAAAALGVGGRAEQGGADQVEEDGRPRGMKRRRLSLSSLTGKRDRSFFTSSMLGGSAAKKAKSASPQAGVTATAAPVHDHGGVSRLIDALGSGTYFDVASWLDVTDLGRMDATCRTFRQVNGLPAGPWRGLGERVFYGMELDVGGGFLPFQQPDDAAATFVPVPVSGRTSWKARFEFFQREVPTFSQPFNGREIMSVDHPDEVAYCRCRLRADLLTGRSMKGGSSSSTSTAGSSRWNGTGSLAGKREAVALPPIVPLPNDTGVYVEVEVQQNADNLSLAVVDFEGGGRSSVTFSPETGAVLRERKVREVPRAIEGTYIHLLEAAPPGRKFEGTMGLYLSELGHLAFFRRWAPGPPTAGLSDADFADAPAAGRSEEAAVPVNAEALTLSEVASQASTTAGDDAAGIRALPATPQWETTGFCTDLTWAQGPRLSLCLAFRDNGEYKVRLSRVSRRPPVPVGRSLEAYQDGTWNLLYGDDDHPLAI